MKIDFFSAPARPDKPRSIALDVFAGQKTTAVLKAFKDSKTITSFISECCTGLVQPLDTAVNKTLKLKISELIEVKCYKNAMY